MVYGRLTNDNEEVWVPASEVVRLMEEMRAALGTLVPAAELTRTDAYLDGVKDALGVVSQLIDVMIERNKAFPSSNSDGEAP